jgi:hypothetical protein
MAIFLDMHNDKEKIYFTPKEISSNDTFNSCWIVLHDKVFDLTSLLKENQGDSLSKPIINAAGTDISHWFDKESGNPKTHIDPLTNCISIYAPQGRFLHTPPPVPRTDFCTKTNVWWKNDNYVIGFRTRRPQSIKLLNLLTSQEYILEVCIEETFDKIRERYEKHYNAHARGYLWKRCGALLDMSKTMEENGIPVEQLDGEDEWIPTVHLYFSDDLTVG